jgi:hypothetical protein
MADPKGEGDKSLSLIGDQADRRLSRFGEPHRALRDGQSDDDSRRNKMRSDFLRYASVREKIAFDIQGI